MPRKEFSKKTKVATFTRAKGRCERCHILLAPGNIEYDHVVPDQLTGLNEIENCEVLCRSCHRTKTNKDIAVISKAKRQEAKHIGAVKRSGFPTNRSGRWKKKMDGTVVRR